MGWEGMEGRERERVVTFQPPTRYLGFELLWALDMNANNGLPSLHNQIFIRTHHGLLHAVGLHVLGFIDPSSVHKLRPSQASWITTALAGRVGGNGGL